MTTRDYLGQLLFIDTRIEDKMEESNRWREIALGASFGGDDLGAKVQTSKKYDRMGDAVTNAVLYETESRDLANMLTEKKHRIINQIDQIKDGIAYKFLKGFYVRGQSVREIGSEVGYSRSRSYQVFEASLLAFEEQFGHIYL